MTSTLDALAIRRRLGRKDWSPPIPLGPDGWLFDALGPGPAARVLITAGPAPDDPAGGDWWHALLAFLKARADTTRSPLVQAVYAGLADRIRRGDFDEKEE